MTTGGQGTVPVHGHVRVPLAPVIEEGVARTGVEGDEFALRPDPGHVGHTSDVDEGHRALLQSRRQSAVIDRHQGSALPARRHVCRAHVVDHGGRQLPGQAGAKTELHGEAALRAVDDGLAVKADHVDIGEAQPLPGDETLDRLRMPVREGPFGLGQDAGAVAAAFEGLRGGNRILQQGLLVRPVGEGGRKAALHMVLAIGPQQGHVDAVERGAGHQSQRVQRF
jgi:hypothetical protein